nr:MAG: hypothetical protein 2 [Guangxi cystovirus 7]QYF49773.1 MAG: hypothetical protein 2 [Guangxi cystovirus 15]
MSNSHLVRSNSNNAERPVAIDTAHVIEHIEGVLSVGGLCAGLKTSVLLVDQATRACIGRCESAGVRKGNHQIVITFDRVVFRTYICKFAQPGSPVVFYDSGAITKHRMEVRDGA